MFIHQIRDRRIPTKTPANCPAQNSLKLSATDRPTNTHSNITIRTFTQQYANANLDWLSARSLLFVLKSPAENWRKKQIMIFLFKVVWKQQQDINDTFLPPLHSLHSFLSYEELGLASFYHMGNQLFIGGLKQALPFSTLFQLTTRLAFQPHFSNAVSLFIWLVFFSYFSSVGIFSRFLIRSVMTNTI